VIKNKFYSGVKPFSLLRFRRFIFFQKIFFQKK